MSTIRDGKERKEKAKEKGKEFTDENDCLKSKWKMEHIYKDGALVMCEDVRYMYNTLDP